ncbi:TPA: hypothetical protein ACY3IJ_002783 [Enterobacter asburiae]
MSNNDKSGWKPAKPAPVTKERKSGHTLNDSEPIKFDSSIPVPKGKVVTEGFQPTTHKKEK